MLIIKAYINSTQIDEIHIRNLGGDPNGLCTYAIDDPPDYKMRLRHDRTIGWRDLAHRALDLMVSQDAIAASKLEFDEQNKQYYVKKLLDQKLLALQATELGVPSIKEITLMNPYNSITWAKMEQQSLITKALEKKGGKKG